MFYQAQSDFLQRAALACLYEDLYAQQQQQQQQISCT